MKRSEARILIFLSNAHNTEKYAQFISDKLEMDYAYTVRVLNSMKFYKTLIPIKVGRKIFYKIGKPERVQQAMNLLGSQ
jgi:hypothetical protein